MIEIDIPWRPFCREEMPDQEMNIVLLINSSLESESPLRLRTDYWTGSTTERFREVRIAFWAPSNEVIIREKKEPAHVA
jgi:hypothetical protein